MQEINKLRRKFRQMDGRNGVFCLKGDIWAPSIEENLDIIGLCPWCRSHYWPFGGLLPVGTGCSVVVK